MFHWLNNQEWFTQGANYWQWITSIAAVIGWLLIARSHSCGEPRCIRLGQVPVEGTHHKVCKKHAKQQNITHK